jgi:hypothetical protein
MKKNSALLYKVFFAAALILPLIFALTSLSQGTVPFWYDPARDLLMALDNHQKISLIGQTSGIPGIFYGPYWIWLISLALFVSYDPRVIIFLVLTLPYFVLFPLLLFKFKIQFGKVIPILLWLLFALSFSAYATQLWNPHLAPLFCLLTIFLLVAQDYQTKQWKAFLWTFAAGLSAGFLMNTHISFGLAVIVGSYLFLLLNKNKLKSLPLFTAGILIMFLPFFAFEARHGFNQIKTVLATVSSSKAVVKETSVDKVQIINLFFGSFARLLQIPLAIAYLVLSLLIIYGGILFKKKKLSINQTEKKLLLLLGTIIVATFVIYLSTKNPVWEYHFIGVEIIFLLLLGFLAKKNKYIMYILGVWVFVLAIIGISNYIKGFSVDQNKISTLAAKEHAVNIIYTDINDKKFTVYTYSPTTFTPDYDYLLLWKGMGKKATLQKNVKGEIVYLIIPWTTPDLKADFIDNRTPHARYHTVKSWHMPDEVNILKRIHYEKK